MQVLFLGTPDFAIPSLQALIECDDFEVIGVVTQPDKKRGRDKTPSYCAVKAFALKNGLNVYSFNKIRLRKNREFLETLSFDVMVTAAYGQILSRKILDIPPYGCVNVHASLLPNYRGAAPIQWAVINGEKTTGITTMLTERGLDCGDVLMQVKTDIKPDDTTQSLFDKLSNMGGPILIKTLKGLKDKTITPIKQDESQATHYPMLNKSHGKIDWNNKAQDIHNLVRGVNPWPGAYTYHNDKIIKIWKTSMIDSKPSSPGMIVGSNKYLDISCNDAVLRIDEMQIPGKKRMKTELILRGYNINKGEYLE